MKLAKDLREFLELLSSSGVEFLVVGGHAVAFHGYPRYTGDVDFWIRPTPEHAQKLGQLIRDFGFPDAADLAAGLADPDQVVQLGRPPNRIDLLTSLSGLDFEDAWRRSIAGDLDGLPVRFLDFESLLANKRAAGRGKDLGDIVELERLSGEVRRHESSASRGRTTARRKPSAPGS